MKFNPMLICDFYKLAHREQYPDKTQVIYSTWIPRTSRISGITEVVAAGIQGMVKEFLIGYFNENFFNRPKDEVVNEYARYVKYCLGVAVPYTKHIEELHDLGYLPLNIRAVDEGTLVPLRVPMMVINNTDDRFYWLVNSLETVISDDMWQPSTVATLAFEYKKILTAFAKETVGDVGFVQFQGHDFSMRGMAKWIAAASSCIGHLLSFVGTDTIPAIGYLEAYYNANIEKELVGCSVPATEHSVMCAGGASDEYETYRRLIEDIYPSGIVSIVSDTWDLWKVVTDILPRLKDKIMARDGKVVIRPDSGDPADILCGDALLTFPYDMEIEEVLNNIKEDAIEELCDCTPHGEYGGDPADVVFMWRGKTYKASIEASWNRYDKQFYYIDGSDISYKEHERTAQEKGLIECLWELFGGTMTAKGYKLLDSHIGAIYGDSITIDRARNICSRLKAKGFASINVVLGIGSYTYQYNTRDTFGFAMKSTHCVIDGKEVNIFKDPATDTDKVKKSLTGRVIVTKDAEGKITCTDGLSVEEEQNKSYINLLTPVFLNGVLIKDDSLAAIRQRLSIN